MSNRLLLISGLPAAGKSSFGKWLETEKKSIHYNVESKHGQERLERDDLLTLWNRCTDTRNVPALVAELRRKNRPIVWDWGFPPKCLHIVEALKKGGFTIWWFDADRVAARQAFLDRGDTEEHIATIDDFDTQVPAIDRYWGRIKRVFTPNILETLKPDGTRMPPEEIYRKIMGGGKR